MDAQTNSKPVIVTVPYAGGSAAAYIKLFSGLEMDVLHYDYPGHGGRIDEPYKQDIQSTARDLAEYIRAKNTKYYLFGHSMGGMVSFYCESLLEKQYGLCAERLFLSACLPPEEFYQHRLILQSSDEVKDYLIKTRKLPPQLLSLSVFKKNILDQFEHDISILHRFEVGEIYPIEAPVTCILGDNDADVDEQDVRKWGRLTKSQCEIIQFHGDHFYFEENGEAVLNMIHSRI